MRWTESGMYSRDRRESEVTALLASLGRETGEERRLTAHLDNEALRLDRHEFVELLRDVDKRIAEHLTNGALLVAVKAVDQLFHVEFVCEEPAKISRLMEFLMAALDRANDLDDEVHLSVIASAVETFGRLVKIGGMGMHAESGRRIQKMLGMIDPSNDVTSTVGLRLLTEMARSGSTKFGLYVEAIVNKLRPIVLHERTQLRMDGLETLNECLKVINQRAPVIRQRWFQDVAKDFMKVISESRSDVAARGLAVLRTVLQYGSGSLAFLLPSLVEMIISFVTSRDDDVQKEAIITLPVLAQASPQSFLGKNVPCLDDLLACLQKRRWVSESLEAIEELMQTTIEYEATWTTKTEVIADCIREICRDASRPNTDREAAVKCVGQLAVILEQDWKPQVTKLMPQLMSLPIDQNLLDMLWTIQSIYPNDSPLIRSSLLRKLIRTHWENNSSIQLSSSRADVDIEGEMLMGLKLLGMFQLNVDAALLTRLVGVIEHALGINIDADMRKAAADACFCFLAFYADQPISDDISISLDKLCDDLTAAAVIDTSDRFRIDLISELLLQEELHERLSQDAVVRRLGYALYDAHLSIRQLTIQLLARLSLYNVSAVRPLLRELLSKLMDDLRFNGDVATTCHIVGDGALLLRTLTIDQQQLMEMHRPQILEVLLSRLERFTQTTSICRSIKDPTTDAVCALLLALAEVIKGAYPHLLEPNITRLAGILTHLMKDNNDREKQLMAVKTLQQICDASGEMLMQQLQSSDVHACLSDLKSHPRDAHVLDAVIRSLSKWDPTLRLLGPETVIDVDPKTGAELHPFPTDEVIIGDGSYFSSVAIHALLAVLEDTRMANYDNIVKCLMSIFRLFQKYGVVYLQRVVPVLIKVVRQADDRLRRMLFAHLSDLVRIAGNDVTPYIKIMMELCLQFWVDDVEMTTHVLNLIRELAEAVDVGFGQFLGDVVPRLGRILSDADAQLVEPALSVLQACDSHLGPYLPVLFPTLVQFLQKVHIYESPMPLNVQRKVLETLRHILLAVSFREEEKSLMASKLFLTLVRLIRREEALKVDAMDTLAIVISVLGPAISRIYSRRLQNMPDAEEHLLTKGIERLMDPEFDQASIFAPEELDGLCSSFSKLHKRTISTMEPFQLEIESMRKVWDTTNRNTKEDWEEWMRSMGVEFLRQSPSAALRACHCLAEMHPSAAKWLFKYSLLSVWSKMNDEQRSQLRTALATALLQPIPSEVLQPIVGLKDYLYLIQQQDIPVSAELTELDALAESCHPHSDAVHNRKYR